MLNDDPLLSIQEQAAFAAMQVRELAKDNPLAGAAYGFGQTIELLAKTLGEVSAGLSSDERQVLGEAVAATQRVIDATADAVKQQ